MSRIGAALGLQELGLERLPLLFTLYASIRNGCQQGDEKRSAQREHCRVFIRKERV